MNILLIFFAIPLAVIIISAILETILKNPSQVAAIIFSILLVIAIAAFDPNYLVAVLAYTILAFLTALLTNILNRLNNNSNNSCENNTTNTLNDISIENSNYNNDNNNCTCSYRFNRYRRI